MPIRDESYNVALILPGYFPSDNHWLEKPNTVINHHLIKGIICCWTEICSSQKLIFSKCPIF